MQQKAEVFNLEERRPIVKADIEDGYDRLAHTLTNTLMVNNANLTAREMQVVFAIISKTYRFHKKEDWITNSQICELTKMSKGHVSNLMKSLISKNVVIKNGNKTGINSLVSEWKVHNLVNKKSSQPSVQQFTTSCMTVHNTVNNSSQPSETHKKETNTKETNTKDYSASRKKPSKSIDPNFSINQEMRNWAKQKKITTNLDHETEQFVDYHMAKDSKMADWVRAWQTWMRNSVKFSKSQNNFGNRAKPENFSERDYGEAEVNF